jgi:serine/threonine protein kinase
LALGVNRAREVDIVIVADRRIFVIDLKDWHGRIESIDGRWELDGRDMDASPVAKIIGVARDIYILLREAMSKRPETKDLPVPRVEGLVVLTGNADRSGIAATELSKVLTVDEFLASVASDKIDRKIYGPVAEHFIAEPLTEHVWKDRLSRFFNAGTSSPFKPGRRSFQRYVAEEASSFAHPKDIYREYEAREDGTPPSLGTLRLWDFTKIPDGRFQTEEGRREIAGRERQVYHWLRDRSERVEQSLLTPRIDDPELGVNYWEIYDRRRRLKRLSEFALTETPQLSPAERIELGRQLLSRLADMHHQEAAHLDLGAHSIWLEAPTTVRLSHLFAARFADVKSLGPTRYHFLAAVELPEDILGSDHGPMRRDVFLVSIAVHQILFGKAPDGKPPEWDAVVDAEGAFRVLHDWFAEGLDIDPKRRFADARDALEAYNKATAEHPTFEEVLIGLDAFRRGIRSQLMLLSSFPMTDGPLRESDGVDAWRSVHEGRPVVVKMWKQAAWGDLKKEGARILAFLQRAAQVAADNPDGVPLVRCVFWLGDAIALVQDWAEGLTLREIAKHPPDAWQAPATSLAAVRALIHSLDRLHETGLGHGDLKPDNVVVADEGKVLLIDILDFSPLADGEKQSGAYAPAAGSRFERDRFAATKIAEEFFALARFAPEDAARLAKAITTCREKEPKLTTLLPLEEAIVEIQEKLARPATEAAEVVLSLSIRSATIGPLEPDEGFFYIRLYPASARGPATLHLRGAAEEIEVRLDEKANPVSARRRELGQTHIGMVARHEFHRVEAEVKVSHADHTDLNDLEVLLADPTVRAKIDATFGVASNKPPSVADEIQDPSADDDDAEESLVEEIAVAEPSSLANLEIDVPLLWRTLIETEKELTTEGVAEADSGFDRATRLHRIPLDLQSGSFDFDRNDTVGVLRQDRRGEWRRIGELDIKRTRASVAMVDASAYGPPARSRLVEAGQRLRFVSHFETESLRRRTDAVERILKGTSREAGLLAVFDPRKQAQPKFASRALADAEISIYGFNEDQLVAFKKLINARPVGLLQGPPGTGKTLFIAALAHYAITKGLARNVLLSSQSHEAVNTAGEALLKLFRKTGGEPSILRVAMSDDQVSDPIRPFHTRPVEQGYKDRFAAEFHERMLVVGRALGIADDLTEEIVDVERAIHPIVSRIIALQGSDHSDAQRLGGLRETLTAHVARLQLDPRLANELGDDAETYVRSLLDMLLKHRGHANSPSADKIMRLRTSIRIGHDFIGSASRAQRSFETFLAGTRQIVLGTCVGLGRTSLGLTNTAFDLVIVDEAARCTASELLVPLQAARWAVLVGDQAQLQPHHESVVIKRVAKITGIAKTEIQRSDFERVFLTKYAADAGARLKTQYRMLPPIGELISEVFYPDLTLGPGRPDPEIPLDVLPAQLSHPLTWVATDDLKEAAFERKKDQAGSRTNRSEADAILAMLSDWYAHESFRRWMMTQTIAPVAIGVICTYAAQRDLLHQHILRSPLGHLLGKSVKVGTVDSYQGKENPIVILSLVRHNREGLWETGLKTIKEGFLASPNRINVAASRAKDRLVIVGAYHRWRTDGPMGHLVKAFARQEQRGAANIISADQVLGMAQGKRDAAPKLQPRSAKVAVGNHG